jgi:dephospho-CoA kinase
MYLIGLTGNIASGKSTIAAMLAERGAQIIDADELAHVVLLRGRPAWQQVVHRFGPDVLRSNGQIDRRKLGRIVFGAPDKLRQLEEIIHPAVRVELAHSIRESRKDILVIEAVKLIEGGLVSICDSIWVVTCEPEEAKRRLLHDRMMTSDEANSRLESQPPIAEKVAVADVVIDNSGSIDNTETQVAKAWAHISPPGPKDKSAILSVLFNLNPSADAAARTHTVERPPPPSAKRRAPAPSTIAAPLTITPPATEVASGAQLPLPPVNVVAVVSSTIAAYRARPADLSVLSEMLARKDGKGEPLDQVETMQRLGKWGYWLVSVDEQPRGLIAWRAENLVGVIKDCWFEHFEEAQDLLSPLLLGIEQEARTLVNEVLILIIAPESAPNLAPIAESLGYSQQSPEELHSIWREVLREHLSENDQFFVKRLRDELVTRPI